MLPPRTSALSLGSIVLSFLSMAPFQQLAAGYEVEAASFGSSGQIAPEGHLKNWILSGQGFTPEIKSDRIILTPPYPGQKQGAAWTEHRMHNMATFLVDFDFRATGPDNGQGQLQLWYTRENQFTIGSHNLYSVDRFTGFALLIDQAPGSRGGAIRAFLNDGNTVFANSDVERLTFGHCDYAYRNLGRPSKLQLHQDDVGLEVLVDGRRCFRAEGVFLPTDGYFGITANTGESPDSFEIFKFVTQSGHGVAREEPMKVGAMGNAPQANQVPIGGAADAGGQQANAQPVAGGAANGPALGEVQAQVVTLGNSLSGGVSELKQQINNLAGTCASKEELRALSGKIDRISQLVDKIASEQRDWSGHFKEIHTELRAGANMFIDKLPEKMGAALTSHGPNMLQIVFILIAAQLVMGLGYIFYKRKQSTPKKYL